MENKTIRAILFDFDGTLADTAPDLVAATQAVLAKHGKPPMPYEILQRTCSSGARGLLGAAFGVGKDDAAFEPLRQDFLTAYRACLTQDTRLYEGVVPLLQALNSRGLPWGIVTNKATDLTTPIVAALFANATAHHYAPPSCVVCGDTTAYAKPHAAPMLEALRQLNLRHHLIDSYAILPEAILPENILYLGDDERDILAAHAAGMAGVGVMWGYHPIASPPQSWGAAAVLDAPLALFDLLDLLSSRD